MSWLLLSRLVLEAVSGSAMDHRRLAQPGFAASPLRKSAISRPLSPENASFAASPFQEVPKMRHRNRHGTANGQSVTTMSDVIFPYTVAEYPGICTDQKPAGNERNPAFAAAAMPLCLLSLPMISLYDRILPESCESCLSATSDNTSYRTIL